MRLTPEQIEDFHRAGWLFLPELFTPEEVQLLRREAPSPHISTTRPSA